MKSENRIQQEAVIKFNNRYPKLRKLFFSIPNGGARSSREGKLLKETGLVAGASDMMFLFDKRAYCFEFKTETGVQSNLQRDWELRVTAQGIPYHIVRDSEVCLKIIKTIVDGTYR